ncbi:outer membrane protein transport protein [Balneolaceae bacterium ANBcel3]|nr:outer membrane protein transport protein [Balneolaceae bacterium ANBcel3]
MKQIATITILFSLILTMTASTVFAGGYQLNLHGQRQIGMGHAGTGLPLDVSTIALNPAGLAVLDHNGVLLGSSATFIKTTFKTGPDMIPGLPADYKAETDNPMRTPFNLYASYDLPIQNLRAGLGVYTPYGNAVRWGEDWMYSGLLSEISMFTVFVQPTLSFKVNDNLSFGAGLIVAYGDVNLQRNTEIDLPALGLSNIPLSIELDGSTTNIGYNLGMFVQQSDVLSIGVSYRSKINMDVKGGDADFILGGVPAEVSGMLTPAGNAFDATLPLPAVVNLGIGIRPTETLRIAVDANLTFWSAYEDLTFTFEQRTALVQNSSEPRKFNDKWIFRAGGEYDVNEQFQVRLGGYYDASPVDAGFITPETPDVDRFGISTGASYAFTPALRLDASLLFITSSEREQSLEKASERGTPSVVPVGTFQTTAFIPGLAVSYRF